MQIMKSTNFTDSDEYVYKMVPDIIFAHSESRKNDYYVSRTAKNFKIEMIQPNKNEPSVIIPKISFKEPYFDFEVLQYLSSNIEHYNCYIITTKKNVHTNKEENMYLIGRSLKICLPQTILDLTCEAGRYEPEFSFYSHWLDEIDLREYDEELPILEFDEYGKKRITWGHPPLFY